MKRQYALLLAGAMALPLLAPAAAATAGPQISLGGPRPVLSAPFVAVDSVPDVVAIWFSQPSYHWGDLARFAVVTTNNGVLVEMRVGSYGRALTRKGIGTFDGVYRVPFMPPLLDRIGYALPVNFIVRNPSGAASSVDLTLPVN